MIIDRTKEITALTEEEFNAGLIRIYLNEDGFGERIWGWASPEEKEKENITAVFVNHPLNYSWLLQWGSEVKLTRNRYDEFILDPKWLNREINELKGVENANA